MRAKGLSLLAVAAIVAAPVFATAQDRYFGPDVGFFYPSNATMRAALGDQWISFGASSMSTGNYQSSALGTNWNAVSQNKNGNSVFMASYSLGTMQLLGGNRGMVGGGMQPFLALRGGLSYIDYAIGAGAGRTSAKKFGYNANAELGIHLSQQFVVSARYDIYSRHDGFTFDGLTLNLRYGLVRF
ncbi:MAG: hypothetical protein KDC26_03715 [Armatimonadetes bacterium]|nr:hypothetical protein [Armatimonadota bacterium]